MPKRPLLATMASIAILLGCADEATSPSELIPHLAGTWVEVTCSIDGTQPPHRSEACVGPFPDSLTVATNGSWSQFSSTPPGEDPVPVFTGRLLPSGVELHSVYDLGGFYVVMVNQNRTQMSWTTTLNYTFATGTEAEPAVATLRWSRKP